MPTSRHAFIYLASQSPRRRELLDQLGVRHELLLAGPDEDVESLEAVRAGELPAAYVERVTRAKLHAAQRRRRARGLPAAPDPVRRHHRRARPPHPRQAGRRGRRAGDAAPALGPHASRDHRGRAGGCAQRAHCGERLERALRDDRRGRAGALRRQRRAVRQGRRLRDPERRGTLDRAHRRQLLRYHGFAPVRDGRSPATGRRSSSDAAGDRPCKTS